MTTITSAPFSSLGLPEPADKMDISSPYNRTLDDFDIDIDIPPRPSDQDEDFILEDLRSDTGTNQQADQVGDTDDFMVDEERRSILSEDRTMRDDDTVQDEHLTDASDTGLEETALNQNDDNGGHQTDASVTTKEDKNDIAQDTEEAKRTSLETISTEPQEAEKELNVIVDNELHEDGVEGDNSNEQYTASQVTSDLTNPEALLSGRERAVDDVEGSADQTQIIKKDNSKASPGTLLEDSNNISRSINDEDASEGPELSRTFTDNSNDKTLTTIETGLSFGGAESNISQSPIAPLPPIIVHYDGNELSLFPPFEGGSSETFLLDDENLVNVSITDLLRACRVVLGETFDEVDELVLSIEALGINLSEECLHAASTSFNDILNVYTKLKHLDGAEIEPLYVILSSKPRFSVRFQLLQAVVSEGRGLSQVPFLSEDINAGEDEEGDEISLHNESFNVNEQHLDDDGEQPPHDSLSIIPPSEANIDESVTLDTNQISNVENEERIVSQTAHTNRDNVDETEIERGVNDESLEYDTITHRDSQTSEFIEEDDLIIYGDDDNVSNGEEGSIDLPEQQTVGSENHTENAENTENVESDASTSHQELSATNTNSFHGDIPYPSIDNAADSACHDVVDNGREEEVTNASIPKTEPEWNDERHSEAIYNANNSDQDEDGVHQDGSPYDGIGNPEDFSEANAPLDTGKEVAPASRHPDAVTEENLHQHHQVIQDDGQDSGMSTKIAARASAQTQVQLSEDTLLPESDTSLYKESLDNPEYGEQSALPDEDRQPLSAQNEGDAGKEEIRGGPINTTFTELPINQVNGESVTSVHSKEQNAASRTNSPSTKRLRSDDLEDCLEGEEVAADNKRIRSL